MIRKHKKSKRVFPPKGEGRDMFGTPQNRAKTWGTFSNKKKQRRDAKKEIKKKLDEFGL